MWGVCTRIYGDLAKPRHGRHAVTHRNFSTVCTARFRRTRPPDRSPCATACGWRLHPRRKAVRSRTWACSMLPHTNEPCVGSERGSTSEKVESRMRPVTEKDGRPQAAFAVSIPPRTYTEEADDTIIFRRTLEPSERTEMRIPSVVGRAHVPWCRYSRSEKDRVKMIKRLSRDPKNRSKLRRLALDDSLATTSLRVWLFAYKLCVRRGWIQEHCSLHPIDHPAAGGEQEV
jgi:hypothetical protein